MKPAKHRTRELLLAQLKNPSHPSQAGFAPEPAYLSLRAPTDDPRLIGAPRVPSHAGMGAGVEPALGARRPDAWRLRRDAAPGHAGGRHGDRDPTGAYILARYAAEAPSMDMAAPPPPPSTSFALSRPASSGWGRNI